MMFAIVSLNSVAMEGLIFYTAAYCFATIGVFAVLIRMKDYTFEGFNGMGKHHPGIAAAVTVFMLSLAGIPATAGSWPSFICFLLLSVPGICSGWLLLVSFARLSVPIIISELYRPCILRMERDRISRWDLASG